MRAVVENVLIEGPLGTIETDISDPGTGARRAISVIAHPHPLMGGTKDNKVATTLASALRATGCVALRPNFRGVGKTQGEHDEGNGEAQDLIAVAAYARRRYGELPLICAGFSFGAYVQTRVAAQIDPAKLVLIAPPVARFTIEKVAAGTLVVHGEKDEVVPLAAVLDWARPQNLPIVVIPGGEHFFHGRLGLLKNIVANYCRL